MQYSSSTTHRGLINDGLKVVDVEDTTEEEDRDSDYRVDIVTYSNGMRVMYDNISATILH